MTRLIALLACVMCISGCGNADDEDKASRQIETVAGPVIANMTTVDNFPQTIVPVSGEQLQRLRSLTDESQEFLRAYAPPGSKPSLLAYDVAFKEWLTSRSRSHTKEQVLEVLGGVLGNRCVDELNMEWVQVTDQYGTDYAVRHMKSEAMGFPFASVLKRINSHEYGFMVGVYATIKDTLESEAIKRREP